MSAFVGGPPLAGQPEFHTGTVKSFNTGKHVVGTGTVTGFGFVSCPGKGDLYFSKEQIHPELQTCGDLAKLAGEKVCFEIRHVAGWHEGGKVQAFNLRRVTSDAWKDIAQTNPLRPGEWRCVGCGMVNFCRALASGAFFPRGRIECSRCRATKPFECDTRHDVHRAPRERSASRKRKKRRKSSSSSSSSSSRRAKKKKKKGSRKRARSKSVISSSSAGTKAKKVAAPTAAIADDHLAGKPDSPAIEAVKAEVLQKIEQMRDITDKKQRLVEWRTLLRSWHPDKNADNVEVATAVFACVQQSRALLDAPKE